MGNVKERKNMYIPFTLLSTFVMVLCHPVAWVSSFSSQLCPKKKKKRIHDPEDMIRICFIKKLTKMLNLTYIVD